MKNYSMKKIFGVCCLLCAVQVLHAQTKTIDSLRSVYSAAKNPMDRFNAGLNVTEAIGFYAGDPDSSLNTELMRIAQSLRNDSLLAISYDLLGQYTRSKGDNAAALEYMFKAIPLAEQARDKRRLSSIYFDIASVYDALNNVEAYGKYNRAGGANMPDTSHPKYGYMLAQYQRGMAIYFIQSQKPDSALTYAQALTATSQRIKSQLYLFNAYFLNAAAYDAMNDKELAEVYFKKARAESVSTSAYSQLRFFSLYIPYLIRYKNYPEAKQQAAAMLNGFASNNNNFKIRGAGYLREIYDALGKPDSAYYYAKKEIELNQIIFNENNNNRIQALAFNEQIRSIEEDARQKEAEEQRKQNLQYALIALGIIVLLSLYLSLSRSFITNTNLIKFFGVIALLIVFEFLNLLLHPFLERITHHSPLLMLLALVCIAALLVPLHHKLEHWATTKLVEKNKMIRLAAAKKTVEELESDKN